MHPHIINYGGVRRVLFGTPADFLGSALAAAWEAADLSDGAVSSWADQVAALTVTQGTGGSQPVKGATSFNRGYPGVTFDGSDDSLSVASTTGLPTSSTAGSIFAVASCTAQSVVVFSYGAAGSGTFRRIRCNDSGDPAAYDGTSTAQNTGRPRPWTGPSIVQADFGAAMSLFADGQYIASTSMTLNTSTTRTVVGASSGASPSQFWGGVISAIYVTTALTAAQAQWLTGWLAHTRGLARLLPAHHPYRWARI